MGTNHGVAATTLLLALSVATMELSACRRTSSVSDQMAHVVGVSASSVPAPEPSVTPWIITPGPGTPTPFLILSDQQALDYALGLFQPPLVLVTTQVRFTNFRDFKLMTMGPEASWVTPDPTYYPNLPPGTPGPGRPVWVVGIVSAEQINGLRLDTAAAMVGLIDHGGVDDRRGHEVYLVMDQLGNVVQSGFLDGPNGKGGVERHALWMIDDIASLPTPVPTGTPE